MNREGLVEPEPYDESIFEPRPFTDYELRFIWYFIRELGGVSRQAYRIIQGWHGPFTLVEVQAELHRRFPIIVLPPNQLEDCLEGLVSRGQVLCVMENPNGRVFVRARARGFRGQVAGFKCGGSGVRKLKQMSLIE